MLVIFPSFKGILLNLHKVSIIVEPVLGIGLKIPVPVLILDMRNACFVALAVPVEDGDPVGVAGVAVLDVDHVLLPVVEGVDGAAGALEEVKRIVAQLRARWPKVRIVLRGDSGFCREELMAWCEAEENSVDFLFGLARNSRLQKIVGMSSASSAQAVVTTLGHVATAVTNGAKTQAEAVRRHSKIQRA